MSLKYGVVLFCFCSFLSNAATCNNTIRVALGSIWPPYYFEVDNEPKGIEIEIMELVFKKAGFCLEYKNIVTMARSLIELEKGNIDAVFAASYKTERATYGFYSIPYRIESIRIFRRDSHENLLDSDSLYDLVTKGFVGAINVGSYFGPAYDEFLNGKSRSEIVKIPTIDRKIKMLQHHRVDFVIEDKSTGLYYLKKHGIDGISMHPFVVYENDVAFLFSQKTFSIDKLSSINAAITDSEDEIERIINSYSNTID